ncbi:hypothetical protein ACNKHU_20580 [Shigella flexneri]
MQEQLKAGPLAGYPVVDMGIVSALRFLP